MEKLGDGVEDAGVWSPVRDGVAHSEKEESIIKQREKI